MNCWRALARRFAGRRAAPEPTSESFNLLPYRHLHALRARRRYRAELAGAVLLGLAAAAAGAAWHARDAKRLLAQRAALEQALGSLAPQLAESARLAALQTARRERDVRLAAAAVQRQRLTDLLAASGRGAALGIGLTDLRQRAELATAQGEAVSYEALEQWIRMLERLPGVDSVKVARLRGAEHAAIATANPAAQAQKAVAGDTGAVPRVDFDLRIAYRPSPAADAPRPRGAAAAAGAAG